MKTEDKQSSIWRFPDTGDGTPWCGYIWAAQGPVCTDWPELQAAGWAGVKTVNTEYCEHTEAAALIIDQ